VRSSEENAHSSGRQVCPQVALVLLERLLSGPLPDPKTAISSDSHPTRYLLVLGGVVVPALLQVDFALFSVLLAADFLGDESRLDGFLGGFYLLAHKLVQRFLVVHAGAGKTQHSIAQIVVSRFGRLVPSFRLLLFLRGRCHLKQYSSDKIATCLFFGWRLGFQV
jgi:hypothetical protein